MSACIVPGSTLNIAAGPKEVLFALCTDPDGDDSWRAYVWDILQTKLAGFSVVAGKLCIYINGKPLHHYSPKAADVNLCFQVELNRTLEEAQSINSAYSFVAQIKRHHFDPPSLSFTVLFGGQILVSIKP